MADLSCPVDVSDHRAHLQRLVSSRWGALAVLATIIAALPGGLALPLHGEYSLLPLWGVLGLMAGINALLQVRLHRAPPATPAAPVEWLSQLLLDIAGLAALVFFSGGATNPLVSLLLIPVAIAALTLPGRHAALATLAAIAAYSALMQVYVPLPVSDAARAARLHLTGMWLTFAASALLIAGIVVRVSRQVRERDAALARAREHALRDERAAALGILAAGAAHELGTPLATIALLAGELARDATLPAAARADLELLREQVGHCKAILTRLSRRADAERLDSPPQEALDDWLASLCRHWQAVRPRAASQLTLAGAGTPPAHPVDPRLTQAVTNLLNNAANASPDPVDVRLDWNASRITLDIRDHGPGYPADVLAAAGRHSVASRTGGSGLGLLLTRSAIEQLGGTLSLANPEGGGALARLDFPR